MRGCHFAALLSHWGSVIRDLVGEEVEAERDDVAREQAVGAFSVVSRVGLS